MESSIILNDFLVAQSNLENVLTRKQFARFFKGASPTVVDKLYDEMVKQRQQTLEQVKRNIKSFEIPIEVQPPSEVQGKFSLGGLLKRLHELQLKLESESGAMDGKIEDALLDLQIHVDELNNLNYDIPDPTELEQLLQSVKNSIAKCETLIDL